MRFAIVVNLILALLISVAIAHRDPPHFPCTNQCISKGCCADRGTRDQRCTCPDNIFKAGPNSVSVEGVPTAVVKRDVDANNANTAGPKECGSVRGLGKFNRRAKIFDLSGQCFKIADGTTVARFHISKGCECYFHHAADCSDGVNALLAHDADTDSEDPEARAWMCQRIRVV